MSTELLVSENLCLLIFIKNKQDLFLSLTSLLSYLSNSLSSKLFLYNVYNNWDRYSIHREYWLHVSKTSIRGVDLSPYDIVAHAQFYFLNLSFFFHHLDLNLLLA